MMPGQQQKPATRSQEAASKPDEASNTAKAANTAAKYNSPPSKTPSDRATFTYSYSTIKITSYQEK